MRKLQTDLSVERLVGRWRRLDSMRHRVDVCMGRAKALEQGGPTISAIVGWEHLRPACSQLNSRAMLVRAAHVQPGRRLVLRLLIWEALASPIVHTALWGARAPRHQC